MSTVAAASDLRRSAYLLLTAVAVAIMAAKVVGVENVYEPSRYAPATAAGYGTEKVREWPKVRPEPTPMLSSNDRSRWATVRALVDEGTFVVGRRENFRPDDFDRQKDYRDVGVIFEDGYQSLDKVMDPKTGLFYSSKPPLFTVAVAGEYWLLKKVFGWSIVADRWPVMCTILLTVNVLPFAFYLVMLGRLFEATGRTDFGRLLAFATACFGTFLTTFAGTLNNHLPAAYCILFAAYPLLKAALAGREPGAWGYVGCGFFAGLATTLDLPAAAFLAAVGLPLLVARPRQAVFFFLPAALLPIGALLACNHAALGSVVPAYSEFGGPWYNYSGSHWAKRGTPLAKGIDFNDEPTSRYAFHLLFGHHGWFSLTLVWLLALAGLLTLGVRGVPDLRKVFAGGKGPVWTPPLFAAMTLVVSAVLFAFYLSRTASYNYGGNTSGPRWLFWLTPLWLLGLPAAADKLAASRAGRAFAAVLLGFAVMSVFYPAWNPWRSPWILQLLEFKGVLHY